MFALNPSVARSKVELYAELHVQARASVEPRQTGRRPSAAAAP